jgi:DNA-binding NtrC family response regulator
VVLEVPPLRARREDVRHLVEHFLAQLNQRHGLVVRGVTPRGPRLLQRHPWRGNVRELEAILEQAMIFRSNEWITPKDLDLPARRSADVRSSTAHDARRGVTAVKTTLGWLQNEVLRLATERREVRRRDVIAHYRVSHEVARREFARLMQLRLLRRVGLGRATRYVPLSFWLTLMTNVAEWTLALVRSLLLGAAAIAVIAWFMRR